MMTNRYWGGRRILLALGVLVLAAGFWAPGQGEAQTTVTVESYDGQHAGEFVVPINKSQILRVEEPFTDLSIGNSEIADVLALTNQTIYILGNAIGTTNLLIYGESRELLAVIDIVVSYDVEGLKARFFELMPEERIGVRATGDSVALRGLVSNAVQLDLALAVAERYAPGHVVNMLALEGSQQVMLQVRFAEVSRSAAKELGLTHIFDFQTGDTVFNVGTGSFDLEGGSLVGAIVAEATGGILAGVTGNIGAFNFFSTLEAMEDKGVVKTLAEPNLIAMSGDTASFLAGGEFPFPAVQSGDSDAITIEFREFGVGLAFTPTVIDDNRINLVVAPEVSSLDFANAVNVQGTVVPALTTRRASTTVELANGQTFALAGLLQNDFSDNISQVPFLGDVPILGALFRSTQYQRNESELVILATPYIVQPMPADLASAPTDTFIPPSEVDLFLWGQMEDAASGCSKPASAEVCPYATGEYITKDGAGGIDGSYGYIVK
jgi:pilus assembly protein CpaC